MKQPILCICNFGLVRSRTMANRLRLRGFKAMAMGFLNSRPTELHSKMLKAETILICNKPNIEDGFAKENIKPEHLRVIKDIIHWHKSKIITIDTIGRDKWAKENHKELVFICDSWLDKNL
jgi:hypothetical protein